jgi:hypothetical protein
MNIEQEHIANFMIEHMPGKFSDMAGQAGVSAHNLRVGIIEGIYYIDLNCELQRNTLNSVCKDFSYEYFEKAIKRMHKKHIAISIGGLGSNKIPFPDFVIHANERLSLIKPTDHTSDRAHGWYRKFEKPNGRRNLKR